MAVKLELDARDVLADRGDETLRITWRFSPTTRAASLSVPFGAGPSGLLIKAQSGRQAP
jgi:hypothetical protein